MHLSKFRPKFTVRRLMVAVAIISIAFGMIDRHYRFKKMADHHLDKWDRLNLEERVTSDPSPLLLELINYHASLSEKYAKAARYPWLPVKPDPPEPK